jgi:hypothetical protein
MSEEATHGRPHVVERLLRAPLSCCVPSRPLSRVDSPRRGTSHSHRLPAGLEHRVQESARAAAHIDDPPHAAEVDGPSGVVAPASYSPPAPEARASEQSDQTYRSVYRVGPSLAEVRGNSDPTRGL